jgi:hypothetical protein
MENLVKKIKEKTTKIFPKLVQTAYATGMLELYLTGEKLQYKAINHLRNYDFWQGHLSDIGSSGLLTSLALMPLKKMKYKIGATLTVPTILTAYYLTTNPLVKDPLDIALFYLTSFASLGVKELTERKSKNKK